MKKKISISIHESVLDEVKKEKKGNLSGLIENLLIGWVSNVRGRRKDPVILELQQQIQQSTLDLRGQWSVGKNDKLNKVETDLAVSVSRIDKLEDSIINMAANIQKIADGMPHAKTSR